MDFNLSELIMSQYLILVPFLYIIGLFLKKWNDHDDRLIPTTLGLLGIIMGVVITFSTDADQTTMKDIVNGIIQGVFCGGMAVFGNELVKNIMSFIQGE